MRYLIFFLSFLSAFSVGHCAASQHCLTKDQIILTNSGMFLLIEDIARPAYSLFYIGDGIYTAEYYGQCGRCGWALAQNGMCTNQTCNQYGPSDRD